MIKQSNFFAGFKFTWRQAFIVLLLTQLATTLSFLIKYYGFTEVNIVIVYILSVLLASRYTRGFVYGIFSSLIATISFNFFFTEPIYTFTVYDKSYIFTFVIMLLAAIFSSTLTSNLINAKERANAQEKQAQILYKITSSLAKTRGIKDVIAVSMQHLSSLFECKMVSVVTDESQNMLEIIKLNYGAGDYITDELEHDQLKKILNQFYSTSIDVQGNRVCIFCLPKEFANINQEDRHLLESVFMQITVAIEREYLTNEKETAKIEAEQERFKSSLLRSVSHDLRTPLSAIAGAAEILLNSLDKAEDINVAAGIYEDSIWLTRLVENILSLTRIQEGRLNVITQPEAVEEIIAESIRRVHKYSPDHKIAVTIPEDVLFVQMDSKLIIQVLINLLENAVKHTSPQGNINVSVTVDTDKVWFTVSDNGEGIEADDLKRLFDIFYISDNQSTDAKRGLGLGLAICKAIVNMHGGEIYAENNSNGGASFRFFLNH